MLNKLSINNYALIESNETEFPAGLSVITGETGSGKSIMLSALQLLLGERADAKSMRDSAKKTVIEAEFSVSTQELKTLFQNSDLEWNDGIIILRREIMPGGRSRAFINDTPVKLNLLEEISDYLIDIHSQHLSIKLLNQKNQMEILDSMSDLRFELENYKKSFRKYIEIRKHLDELKKKQTESKQNNDYLKFQLDELEKLKPKRGEAAQLEAKYEILSNANSIKENLYKAIDNLNGSEGSVISKVGISKNSLSDIDFSIFKGEIGENDFISRLEAVYIELKDISEGLEDLADNINDNPNDLEKTYNRLNHLFEAQKKFHLEDPDKLADLYEQLKSKASDNDNLPQQIKDLSVELKNAGIEMKSKAEFLTAKREMGANVVSKEIEEICRQLGLPNFRMAIEVEKGKFNSSGADSIRFLCSFNKNQELRPIEEIASGGEISRVMLAIKYLLAKKISLPTIIFDEIDSGVSGEIADRMGTMMREMGKEMQVIAITHLPQIASKGLTHFKVYKKDNSDSTLSYIERLDGDHRVRELAVMLSGRVVDEASLRNAESLLNQSR